LEVIAAPHRVHLEAEITPARAELVRLQETAEQAESPERAQVTILRQMAARIPARAVVDSLCVVGGLFLGGEVAQLSADMTALHRPTVSSRRARL